LHPAPAGARGTRPGTARGPGGQPYSWRPPGRRRARLRARLPRREAPDLLRFRVAGVQVEDLAALEDRDAGLAALEVEARPAQLRIRRARLQQQLAEGELGGGVLRVERERAVDGGARFRVAGQPLVGARELDPRGDARRLLAGRLLEGAPRGFEVEGLHVGG